MRLVGSDGIPFTQYQQQVKPLFAKHGDVAMSDAVTEIIFIETTQDQIFVRLTDEARKLARPILGMAPEPAVPPGHNV